MTRFAYKALSHAGVRERGEIEADSAHEAAATLASRNLSPVEIKAINAASTIKLSYMAAGRIGQELGRLSQAGVPLDTGARLAAKTQDDRHAKRALMRAAERLTKGDSAAAAFHDLSGAPGRALAAIIRAGERSGDLSGALASASPLLLATAKFRAKLVSLMLYPILVTVVAVGVLGVFLFVIVPSLRPLLEELGDDMPAGTRLMINAADLAPGFAVGILLLALVWILFSQLGSVRKHLDAWRDRILLSPFGLGISPAIESALFARLFAALIRSGMPAGDALSEAGQAVGNAVMRADILQASKTVNSGGALNDALADALGREHLVTQASELGTRGGHFAQLIEEAGTALADRAEIRLERVAAILGPGIIVLLGAIIGVFVVTLFSSLMALTDAATL